MSGSVQLTSRLLLDPCVARTVGRAGRRRRLGNVRDADRHRRRVASSLPVGDGHRHIECGLRLEVVDHASLRPYLPGRRLQVERVSVRTMEPVGQREHIIVVRRAHPEADDQPRICILQHVPRDAVISERGQGIVLLVGRPYATRATRAVIPHRSWPAPAPGRTCRRPAP